MSQTLMTLSDYDSGLIFRMGRPDFLALLAIVRGGLETDEKMAVLATGAPIPPNAGSFSRCVCWQARLTST